MRRAAAPTVAPLALALLAVALGGPAALAQTSERPPPVPSADAAIVVDGRDGEVMFAKNPDERHSIASTTKLMTALLTLEQARSRRASPDRPAPSSAT